MITADILSALRRAMHDIASQKGDFTLFGLFLRADAPGSVWDLVVSAPWLEAWAIEPINQLAQLLIASMGRERFLRLASVVALDETDPFVETVLTRFPVDDGELRVHPGNISRLDLEDAVILRAKRAA